MTRGADASSPWRRGFVSLLFSADRERERKTHRDAKRRDLSPIWIAAPRDGLHGRRLMLSRWIFNEKVGRRWRRRSNAENRTRATLFCRLSYSDRGDARFGCGGERFIWTGGGGKCEEQESMKESGDKWGLIEICVGLTASKVGCVGCNFRKFRDF